MTTLTTDLAAPARDVEGAGRALYEAALDPEGCFDESLAAALRDELAAAAQAVPDRGLEEGLEAAARWSAEQAGAYRALLEGLEQSDRAVLVRRAALACAPLGLISGAWQQWLSGPGNAEDPAVLSRLRLYASDLGVGRPRGSRGSAYLDLLRQLRLADYAVPTARIALDTRIDHGAFRVPGVLLGLSRRPADFAAELAGADLCLRAIGLLPPLALVRAQRPEAADWSALDPSTARSSAEDGEHGGLDDARAAVAALSAGNGSTARDSASFGQSAAAGLCVADRVGAGFRWALLSLREWNTRTFLDLECARDPGYEMAELLRRRAREGSAYHQRFQLGGRSLSAWLEDSRTDPSGLLAALTESKLVRPGSSAASSLVNGLISERGPMFRVFSPEDREVVRRWIDGLARQRGDRPRTVRVPDPPEARPLRVVPPPPSAAIAGGAAPRIALRAAYHGLIGRNEGPRLRRFALEYAHGWLARAASGVDEGETVLPAEWTPAGLRPWLQDQHDRAGRDFENRAEDPVASREALIDATVQLAPLTLIDGGWLQGFTDHEHASSELGSFLFETYWDELGNGIPRLNHPLIYRKVLAEMGVELPPTDSAEFAEWPGFREESFALPVYWLSVGRFPRRYLPEILGLNLAMELSGVGGTYRRAHQALRAHGFSTRFVDLHNTIDNVATGHSAWAADAIDCHLSATCAESGAGAQRREWERVRIGFRSLSPPDGRRARRARKAAERAGAPR
jgi:hypothetical protein